MARVLKILVELTLTLVAIAIPMLGIWVSTSLAVYLDGPLWLAIIVGVVMFPALPLAWELWSQARRRKKKRGDGEKILTGWDRFVLRTLVLNLVFLGVVLFAWPRQGFAAISTRGDWMLAGATGGLAEDVRGALFDVAGGLEWLYDSATDNPYGEMGEEGAETPAPSGGESGTTTEAPGARLGSSDHRWPMGERPHPLVVDMPGSAKVSVESVARYIQEREPDPFQRIKALHDFAADWLDYDAAALEDLSSLPSQRAADVFAARKAVCAGYAKLMVAFGAVTGDRIVYVTGHSRASGQDLDGIGHAWNAVEIEGRWYLMDVTWDAGFVSHGKFTEQYTTDYLLTPPAVFGLDHLPDDDGWQLRDPALSRGAFLRQPALSPRFFAHGMTLRSPTRSQIDVEGSVELVVDNPRGIWVMGLAADKDGGDSKRCSGDSNAAQLRIRCELPDSGTYQIELYANQAEHGTYTSVGFLEVHAD